MKSMMKRIRTILIYTLLSTLLFAATPEQVEHYIDLSSSEEQLISLEQQFSSLQRNLNGLKSDEEASPEYDMQLLSIRFREYLQKNLSEDEMDEIIKAYRSVVLLKFASVQNDSEYDEKEAEAYVKALQNEENASVRLKTVEKIAEKLYTKENIGILFDNLMKPFLMQSKNGDTLNEEALNKNREAYIKTKQQDGQLEIAYITREFSMEELEALLEIIKSPAVDRESKVVFAATAYALKEFFLSLASRYDVNKHKR